MGTYTHNIPGFGDPTTKRFVIPENYYNIMCKHDTPEHKILDLLAHHLINMQEYEDLNTKENLNIASGVCALVAWGDGG